MNWKDAERNELIEKVERLSGALRAINAVAGNLSDDRVMAIGGVNSGTSRAIMVVGARELAVNALRDTGFDVEDFSGE